MGITKKVRYFFSYGIWDIDVKKLGKVSSKLFIFFKIWVIAIKEYHFRRGGEKASALTFFTLLSIVPFFALLFAIAKGFGIEKVFLENSKNYLSGQAEIFDFIVPYAEKTLETTHGGWISSISIAFLFYVVIRLLSNIEAVFNHIWHVKSSRSWDRKIADYLMIVILGPVLIIISSSFTVLINYLFQNTFDFIGLSIEHHSVALFIGKIVPYIIIWVLLTLLYLLFPNTKVKFFPALVAAIIAGTLYQLTQWGFLHFQFAFARYNTIYGSLALLPLFLIWLQLSWLIVVFGAQFSYAVQHHHDVSFNYGKMRVSIHYRKQIMLVMLYRCCNKFREVGPAKFSELIQDISLPYQLLSEIFSEMVDANILSKVYYKDEPTYQPSFDIHRMDAYTVLQRYEQNGINDFKGMRVNEFDVVKKYLSEIAAVLKSSDKNCLVIDLPISLEEK